MPHQSRRRYLDCGTRRQTRGPVVCRPSVSGRRQMPVIRTYECTDCFTVFECMLDSGSDPDPECPQCSRVLEWRPGMFSVKTNKSRAIDVTQEIMETDYGLTNFKEAPREGDVSAIMPSET